MNFISASVDLVMKQANAVASTVASAKPYLPQNLTEVSAGGLVAGLSAATKRATEMVSTRATEMVSTREGAAGAAVTVVGFAVSAYFLWPAGATVAAAGAMMKAPGAAGLYISRAAFLANPQLYYQMLRTAGAAAAAAAFGAAVAL